MSYLKATGANWISIVALSYQESQKSTTIFSGDLTPSDADIVRAIRQAKSLGLNVMLKPQMTMTSDPSWVNGPIGTGFATEAEWDAWFSSYRTWIGHYADLAKANGVELFCVGTEMAGTSQQSARWRQTVADVRSRFGGPLTYSAMPGEEGKIQWWDAVDYIGANAYYFLTDVNNPTLSQLKVGWQTPVRDLGWLSSHWQRPVIFTEIGYRDLDGTNRRPGDWGMVGPADPDEQALCYRAAFESVWNQPWFVGMFWWEWGTDPNQGLPPNTDYTPHNRPAEQVLKSWYAAPDTPTPSATPVNTSTSTPTPALSAGYSISPPTSEPLAQWASRVHPDGQSEVQLY
ncbi:MAG: glycosyl hydrolase family 53 [Chloroflexi bacterium]|nr:glycosyl hydrolase family 53 [Chloroflexota bacterium]